MLALCDKFVVNIMLFSILINTLTRVSVALALLFRYLSSQLAVMILSSWTNGLILSILSLYDV